MSWTKVGETTFRLAVASDNANLPGGLQEGDIVVIAGVSDAGGTIDGTGYTSIYLSTANDPASACFYKLMGATPDTTITLSKSQSTTAAFVIQAWRPVDQTTPIDAAATSVGPLEGSPDAPLYSSVTDGALICAVGFYDDGDEAANVTAPSGFSNLLAKDCEQAGVDGSTVMIASLTQATAGSVDPGAFGGLIGETWKAITFGLRPGAPSGPVYAQTKFQIFDDTGQGLGEAP